MKKFKELISSQLVSVLSARPFSFFDGEPREPREGELTSRDATHVASESGRTPVNPHHSDSQVIETPSYQPVMTDISHLPQYDGEDKKADPLTKVEELQIKLLRLIHRIGLSPESSVVAQALYRLQLASLIRGGESDAKRPTLKIDKAKTIAAQQEAGQNELNFSFKILVLGKTGVGKSATINSLFGQRKMHTNAFHLATDHIQEIAGSIRGIKVTFIDTPGLSPSSSNHGRNRKIMLAVKRFIRNSPPDLVLYFDRLDFINKDCNDYMLLKLVTDVFGSSIWFNTILVMTHSSSPIPEGPDGFPWSYEAFVNQCTRYLQHQIHRAVSTTQIENPIVLVENHPMCSTNTNGESVLPNGQVWISQFLLLCIATKILGDASSLLKFQDTIQLTQTNTRMPSLPHLLSSFLRHHSLADEMCFGDELNQHSDNDEDEYDKLPPLRILTKAQYQKLSKAQRNAYHDELDYRETLYLKKQWKEELGRRRECMMQSSSASENSDDYESNAAVDAQVSDVPLPLSFDSDMPAYRYRCLLSNDLWILNPVLDSQGWDHDFGFDGISMEASKDVKRNLHGSVTGQMRKDKEDFSIQSECSAKYTDPKGHYVLAGMDIQPSGKDFVYAIHGDAAFKNLYCNSTNGGLSLTSFNNMYFVGAKLEDSILVGRRFKLAVNAGRMGGCGQVAHGGGLETTLRGRDYPARDEKVTLGTTLLSFNKETVIGGNIQADFRVGRSSKMSVNANLNSRRLGQISLTSSTSEHVEIALLGVVPLIQALFRRRASNAME